MSEEFIFALWFLGFIIVAIGLGMTLSVLEDILEELRKVKK